MQIHTIWKTDIKTESPESSLNSDYWLLADGTESWLHRSQIPDRSIEPHTQTDLRSKFQLYTAILFSEIRLKTVEYAQFKFDHHFWSNLSQSWPKCFQTGRISSEAADKKPAMGRISTKSDVKPT
jgi:hypothetical protein